MKKLLKSYLFMAIVFSIILTTGCSGTSSTTEKVTANNEETENLIDEKERTEAKDIKLEDVTYDWSKGVLAEEVPLPDVTNTSVEYDGNDSFNVKIFGDFDSFKEYIERCKDYGYTCEAKDDSIDYYSAYKEDGIHIEVKFEETEGMYELSVRESWIKDPLIWPESGLAAKVPTPKGRKGKITGDSSEYFSAVVGEMTEKDYNEYIKECRKLGYTLDESKWEGYFSAYHEKNNGDAVTVEYIGLDSVRIEVFTGQKK